MMVVMPIRTDREHLDPYWKGNSVLAIYAQANKPVGHDGGRFTDTNLQACEDDDLCVHWADPAQNGYLYIVRRGGIGRRRLSPEEAHRAWMEWKEKDAKRLRRTKRAGISFESRVRILTMSEFDRKAKRNGVIPIFELKSRAYRDPRRALRLVMQRRAIGQPPFFMALITMRDWGLKAAAITGAGGQFGLLVHGAAKPEEYAAWTQHITRRWGAWGSQKS